MPQRRITPIILPSPLNLIPRGILALVVSDCATKMLNRENCKNYTKLLKMGNLRTVHPNVCVCVCCVWFHHPRLK